MIAVIVFLYGLVIGSFLNVCAFRIPKKQSIVSPSSYCPHCNKPVKFYDNIPVISYILLGGKCRYCKQPISLRYPLVELLTGLLFLATYLAFGLNWVLLPSLLFVALLFVILLIDLDHQIIPNGLIIFGFAAGFIFLAGRFFTGNFPLVESSYHPLLASVGSGILAGLALLVIAYLAEFFLKKEAMGGGDIKLAAVLGLFLGPYVFLSLFLAFLIGAVVSVTLMVSGLVKQGDPVPFGPFMAVGALLTLYFGPQIWHWYLSLLY